MRSQGLLTGRNTVVNSCRRSGGQDNLSWLRSSKRLLKQVRTQARQGGGGAPPCRSPRLTQCGWLVLSSRAFALRPASVFAVDVPAYKSGASAKRSAPATRPALRLRHTVFTRRRMVGRRPWRTCPTLRGWGTKNFRSCFHAHGNSGFSVFGFACRLEVGLVLATDRGVRRRADLIRVRRRTDFDSQPSRGLGGITRGRVWSRIFYREMTHEIGDPTPPGEVVQPQRDGTTAEMPSPRPSPRGLGEGERTGRDTGVGHDHFVRRGKIPGGDKISYPAGWGSFFVEREGSPAPLASADQDF
jgi:hypothetical protein